MRRARPHRLLALVTSAALLALLTAATLAAPASAARPKCQGLPASIVGTAKSEIIQGTAGRDIIVARGGNDRIYGKGGNDIICGGGGNDIIYGGPGADRLWGQLGHDKLFGNAGPDFLAGQVGNDPLNGGTGVDTCFQGTGTGPVVACERPAPPPPPPPPPTGPSLIPLTGILAVAYSDIDGLPGYSTGDVMIARLMDSDGNGVVSTGDTIEMGRYPINPTASGYGDWQTTKHSVVGVDTSGLPTLVTAFSSLYPSAPVSDAHTWYHDATGESYRETRTYEDLSDAITGIEDRHTAPKDRVFTRLESPSQPVTTLDVEASSERDDGFIDVEIYAPA